MSLATYEVYAPSPPCGSTLFPVPQSLTLRDPPARRTSSFASSVRATGPATSLTAVKPRSTSKVSTQTQLPPAVSFATNGKPEPGQPGGGALPWQLLVAPPSAIVAPACPAPPITISSAAPPSPAGLPIATAVGSTEALLLLSCFAQTGVRSSPSLRTKPV